MKKTFICIMILSLMFCLAYSQEKPLISIMNFACSGLSESEARIITDYLGYRIVETGLYQVIDRSQRDIILSEQKFSLSGCVDDSCQIEIGRLLQADEIIVGSIGKLESRYVLNMKLLNVETGATIQTFSNRYESIQAILDDSKSFIFQFFLEKDMRSSFRESEITAGYYDELLEGFDPPRFERWLTENGYEQEFIAGDGYMKAEYIKKYKSRELGMRFTLSPEIGFEYMFGRNSDGHNYQTSAVPLGVLISFQPALKINFGFSGYWAGGFDMLDPSNDFISNLGTLHRSFGIDAYIAYGNKLDGCSIGIGLGFSERTIIEYSVLLFLKSFHLKISGGYFSPGNYSNAFIGLSGGFSLF